MLPLIVLFAAFLIACALLSLLKYPNRLLLSGRLALAAMLLFTAVGHFVFTKGMAMMIPEMIPNKVGLVYFTGVIEMLAAAAIFIPRYRSLIGWLLIVFFIVVLPSNIYAAINNVNYKTAAYDGKGVSYLWFRISFQLLLIIWTYFFVAQKEKRPANSLRTSGIGYNKPNN